MSSAKRHGAVSLANTGPRAVTKLPPEILARIFRILSDTSRAKGNTEEWISITHVCRFWRAAALHDPTLWTYISESLPPNWIDEYMQRSDPLPVKISYREKSSSTVKDRVRAVILESAHRLGELAIDQRGGEDILFRLNRPAPALTELTIECNHRDRIPQQIFGGHTPCLSRFIASSMIMPLTAPWLCNIRELQLWGTFGFYDADNGLVPINVNHILNLLHSLPKLESLDLEITDQPHPSDTPILHAFNDKLHLTRLNNASFYFYKGGLPLVALFNHISMVAPIHLVLGVLLDTVDARRIQTVCEFFLKHISNTPSSLMWAESRITIDCDNSFSYPDHLNFIIEPAQAEDTLTVLLKHLIPCLKLRTLKVEASYPGWLRFGDCQTIKELKLVDIELFEMLLSTPGTAFPSLLHLYMFQPDISDYIPQLTLWLAARTLAGSERSELSLPSLRFLRKRDLASLRRYVTVSIIPPEKSQW